MAVERDFNAIDVEGHERDALERAYGIFGSRAADALDRELESDTFDSTSEDGVIILNLMALLAVRNPRLRQRISDFRARIAHRIFDLILASKERYEGQVKRARG